MDTAKCITISTNSLRQLYILLGQLLVALFKILLHNEVRCIKYLQPYGLRCRSAIVNALCRCFFAIQHVATSHCTFHRPTDIRRIAASFHIGSRWMKKLLGLHTLAFQICWCWIASFAVLHIMWSFVVSLVLRHAPAKLTHFDCTTHITRHRHANE